MSIFVTVVENAVARGILALRIHLYSLPVRDLRSVKKLQPEVQTCRCKETMLSLLLRCFGNYVHAISVY